MAEASGRLLSLAVYVDLLDHNVTAAHRRPAGVAQVEAHEQAEEPRRQQPLHVGDDELFDRHDGRDGRDVCALASVVWFHPPHSSCSV